MARFKKVVRKIMETPKEEIIKQMNENAKL